MKCLFRRTFGELSRPVPPADADSPVGAPESMQRLDIIHILEFKAFFQKFDILSGRREIKDHNASAGVRVRASHFINNKNPVY